MSLIVDHEKNIRNLKNNDELNNLMETREDILKKLNGGGKKTIELKIKLLNINKEIERIQKYNKNYIFSVARSMDKFYTTNNRKEVYEEYSRSLSKSEESSQKLCSMNTMCGVCNIGMSYDYENHYFFCAGCGLYNEGNLVDVHSTQVEISPYVNKDQAHDKMIHFKRLINKVQGMGRIEIKQDDYDIISNYIHRHKINIYRITSDKMKNILKKNGMSMYYPHIPYLMHKICGHKLPKFNENEVERLCTMFGQVQNNLHVFMPPNRTNLFNYEYTLYKLCEIINRRDVLPFLRIINDVNEKYDVFWKPMVEAFGWDYYKT